MRYVCHTIEMRLVSMFVKASVRMRLDAFVSMFVRMLVTAADGRCGIAGNVNAHRRAASSRQELRQELRHHPDHLPDRTGKKWSRSSARLISTGQLRPLPALHPRPIDVVVYHGPNTTRVAETLSWRRLRA